jgi:hypothetical protein
MLIRKRLMPPWMLQPMPLSNLPLWMPLSKWTLLRRTPPEKPSSLRLMPVPITFSY